MIMIYGGTINVMETSRSIYFYDYKYDIFNRLYVDPLPNERIEPSIFFAEQIDKLYIICGLKPKGIKGYLMHKEIMVLDFNKIGDGS